MKQYYIRFKHVPVSMMFNSGIPVDHVQVTAKADATDYDLQVAVTEELSALNYLPEHIIIQSREVMNLDVI